MHRLRHHSVRLSEIVSTDRAASTRARSCSSCTTGDVFAYLRVECDNLVEGRGQLHTGNGIGIGTGTGTGADTGIDIDSHTRWGEEENGDQPIYSHLIEIIMAFNDTVPYDCNFGWTLVETMESTIDVLQVFM
jgi:hypothetical protein